MAFGPAEYKTRVQIVYILGLFIQIIDGTIVNIAIPTLADEFGVESTDVDWAIIGFYLGLAVVIPAAGWMGDRFGVKKVFLAALGGFVLASVLCGSAQSLDQLIVFRIVQGLFAGMITPIGSAMLYRAFPLAERAKAATAVITVTVIAPAIGPVLGGVLIETLSWRWIFYVNIPIGAAGVVLGWLWLREEKAERTDRIDAWGLVLSGTGLALVLFAVSEGPSRGWSSPLVVGCLVTGLVVMTVLVLVELKVDDPVLAVRLYANRLFRTTNLAAVPIYAGFFSLIFAMPIFMQKLGGHSALVTGLTLFTQPLGIIVTSQLVGRRLYGRYGPRVMLVGGSLATFAIGIMFVLVDADTPLWVITVLMLFRGFAMGTVFIPLQTATYATIPLPNMARATSLFNTQRQASMAMGVAATATVVSSMVSSVESVADGGAPLAERVDAFQTAFLVSALFFLAAAAAAWFIPTEDARDTMRPRSQ